MFSEMFSSFGHLALKCVLACSVAFSFHFFISTLFNVVCLQRIVQITNLIQLTKSLTLITKNNKNYVYS